MTRVHTLVVTGLLVAQSVTHAAGNQPAQPVEVVNEAITVDGTVNAVLDEPVETIATLDEPVEVTGVLGVDVLTAPDEFSRSLSVIEKRCALGSTDRCSFSDVIDPELVGARIYGYTALLTPDVFLETDTTAARNISNYVCQGFPVINGEVVNGFSNRWTNQVYRETIILPRPLKLESGDSLGVFALTGGSETCTVIFTFLLEDAAS